MVFGEEKKLRERHGTVRHAASLAREKAESVKKGTKFFFVLFHGVPLYTFIDWFS